MKKKPDGYWTKENCIADAKKYKTIGEWVKHGNSSYKYSFKNNSHNECCAHMIRFSKPVGYWTKERCIKDSKKYKTKMDWKNNSSAAYSIAIRKKYIQHIKHFKLRFLWTKEMCIKISKKYKTRKEWQEKNYASYHYAQGAGLLKICSKHMTRLVKPVGYWTKERCIKDSKKYKTRSEWCKKSGGAYGASKRNGWHNECCKHMVSIGNNFKKIVYIALFKDNSVYIGLTCNHISRFKQHVECEKESIFRYIKKTGLKPKYKLISSYIDFEKAQKLEIKTIKKYKKDGFNVLNRVAGGAIGGSTIYWTREKCITDAKKYKTKKEWQINSPSYDAAYRNNWIEECSSHMIKLKNKAGYWTKKIVIEELKKNKYKTVSEWMEKGKKSFSAAAGNGWYKECKKHLSAIKKPKIDWTKEMYLKDAKKYNTISEWKRNSGKWVVVVPHRKGWYEECCKHMIKQSGGMKIYWTKKRCMADAKKYKTKTEWYKKQPGAYSSAKRKGWFKACCKHMIKTYKRSKKI